MENLDEVQIQELKETFELFDKDGDGTITIEELDIVFESLGQKLTKEELYGMISDVDVDGDGEIDFEEFMQLMVKQFDKPQTQTELYTEAFKFLDKNCNGLISSHDLKIFMHDKGEQMTEEEIDELIQENDKDQDGHLCYDEFVEMMQQI